jgi:hypothetical protein
MIISSVVVLLLCIRPNDHAGGFCMSPILCIVKVGFELYCLSEPVDVVNWFESIR